jgi:GxxExxY protein
MKRNPNEFAQHELTEKIIGCAYHVYNTLGSGFAEEVYKRSLLIALRKAGLRAASEVRICVYFEGELVGEYVADIIVEDNIILELKAVRTLSLAHEIQLVNYLAATGKAIGLLINFGQSKVEIRRKVRDLRSLPATAAAPSGLSGYPVKNHD